MAKIDKLYEFKSDIFKEFARFPDTKMSARKFVSFRLKELSKAYEKETSVRKKYVIKKIINFYKDVK